MIAPTKLTKSCPTHISPFFFSYSTFIKKECVSPLISRLNAILPSKESDLVLKEPVWDRSGHRAGLAGKWGQVRQAGRLEKPVSLLPPHSWLEIFKEVDPNPGPILRTNPKLVFCKGNGFW